ncbi:peptidase 1 [Auriculariales sp. MPI-PUGE-AT-0066]|nr:peptidase 1 [Auriculariales sp. MPI-PUGE-AT-0066]
MHFPLSILVVVSLAAAAVAAPRTPLPVHKVSGQKRPDGYIVRLKKGASKSGLLKDPRVGAGVTHRDWTAINGFAGTFTTEVLNELRANDAVESISEDGISRGTALETNSPWGLSRISAKAVLAGAESDLAMIYNYTYSDDFQGQGVDVYVVDTGVNIDHVEFSGRATYGFSAPGLATLDDNGHGSNVASIVAGVRYGVAKQANIISVKVLDENSRGWNSDVISGFNFAMNAALASGRLSVVTASLESDIPDDNMDAAAAAVVSAGIPFIAAAGNRNSDELHSPARVETIITVGAVDITDTKASFSNFGAGVDIWAPGVNIYGAYDSSDFATSLFSGTSQATPHVTGLVALYLSQFGKTSPAAIATNLNRENGILNAIRKSDLG